MEKIRRYLQEYKTAKTVDIAELLGLSVARARAVLSQMDDVEALGTNRARVYRLRKSRKADAAVNSNKLEPKI